MGALGDHGWDGESTRILIQSVLIALVGASLLVIIGVGIAFVSRQGRSFVHALKSISLVGYALPGTLIAVAVYSFFSYIQSLLSFSFLTQGGIIILLCGYTVRFLSISCRPLDTGLKSIHQNQERAARSLGADGKKVLTKIYLPLLSGAALSSFLLSFVEIVKEMPMTLMLRPYHVNTLAVKIYELTSEGEWERAAPWGLLLVGTGMISIFFFNKLLYRSSP